MSEITLVARFDFSRTIRETVLPARLKPVGYIHRGNSISFLILAATFCTLNGKEIRQKRYLFP
ncbi:hypothetical protein GmarT_19800 [Gimesia maris]|uniref:Uncharacterized protein n=1 Tax=Gimesia maris TaxID=122 RepID=A0ABX5YK91_9PLAN|nr:hypothetical protein GmarT_19800 [Gimesia maris]